jgi:MerR family mercuric resistance operon transcriptional regulator
MHEDITKPRERDLAAMPIGELSRRTGCNIETIRYYEKIGMIDAPLRTGGRQRIYQSHHVKKLSFVLRARGLGFTLNDVRALLALEERGQSCSEVKVVAGRHLEDVRSKIADLRAMESALEILEARCGDGAGEACPMIEALSRT